MIRNSRYTRNSSTGVHRTSNDYHIERQDASEQNQLGTLEKTVREYQTILSPSHSLPPELLSEIFMLAIPIRTFVTNTVESSNYTTACALSQVCTYWRTVALAMPQIWSSISVIHRDQLESSGHMALTKMFIKRSSGVPLHISIILPNVDTKTWTRRKAWMLRKVRSIPPLLNLIFSHAHRWKSAIIRFAHIDFENFPRLNLPMLESLNYKRVDTCAWPTYSKVCTFGDTPSLRHTILDGPKSQICLPWNQLWHYDGLPMDLEIMRPASSQLRTCILRGPLSVVLYPSTTIVFSNLTSLRYLNKDPAYARHLGVYESIFRWIATPVLENLEIRGLSRIGASLIVADLLWTKLTSSTTLRSLSFHVDGMTEQDLKNLLYSTPCLTTLDICNTPASVFACLRVGAAQALDFMTKPIAPRLQSLIIHDFSHSDTATLCAVYDSRHPTLNTDLKVVPLDITFSYPTFRACYQAQHRIAEGSGMNMRKILGWCNHLVKQFLADFPEKKKKYAVRVNRQSSRRMYSPRELNIFFMDVVENHQFSDPIIIEASGIMMILSEIRDLPPTAILDDSDYKFRQRVEKVLKSWAPLLEDLTSRRRWTLGDDYLTLKFCGPTAICSGEH